MKNNIQIINEKKDEKKLQQENVQSKEQTLIILGKVSELTLGQNGAFWERLFTRSQF
jgi:hypothetical protein